ncbi:MAG: M9 family metallopeptidase, partial [Kangiellaceae bacterium]|nr:M9 family metallopeptidase [Kangiellaceae bacterium]
MKYSSGSFKRQLLTNSSPPKITLALLFLLFSQFSYACDPEAFITTNSDRIIEEIYAQGDLYGDCIGELFEVDADTAEIIFRTNTLLDVAEEANSLARNYNGGGNNNLRDLFYFLRGAYFVDSQYSSFSIDDSVYAASVTAIQTLVDNSYLYQANSSHADLLYNAIVVIDSIGAHSEFYSLMKDWITSWNQDYQNVEDMDLVISTFTYLLKRTISDYDFEEEVLLNDPTIVYALNDYLDNSWMLGTEMEATLADGALLLGRLTALEWYGNANNIESHVDAALDDLFSRYSPTGTGKSLWGNAAGEVLWYGDCSKYDSDVCNFESAFVEPLLNDVYWCDDFLGNGSNTKIRAQDMTTTQARETCELLDDELSRFSDRFGNTVVKNDFSDILEMIIFNSKTDYQIYSPSIFGNSTNNGGIYLEGEPSDPDNIARFITFEFDDSNNPGEFAIKNVEHEYVHYLDGRINRYGSFSTSSPSNGGDIVWWTEGLAEYVAWQDNSPYAPDAMVEGYYRLSEVFVTDYNDSIARIYDWGYAASRFMKECHSDDVDIILENIRKGDYGAYRRYLEKIGDRYDNEFDNWTPGLAANEPSHITDNACDGTSTNSSNINLVAETIQNGDSIPVSLGEAEETLFKVSVANNNSNITASLSNENGDVDIYVLANEPAYQAGYDCKDDEICNINISGANEYYIMLRGYYDVNSANLTVSFDGSSPPSGDEIELTNGSEITISTANGEQVKAFIEVPGGASNLVVSINGSSGDADLYVNRGSYSDSSSADCFNNIGGSNETCDESKLG